MGLTVETGISAITVFAQGLLSFFSPCVLPLVPLYLGYLAGGAAGLGTAGVHQRREQAKLFFRVLCFTVGISGAFFVLGLGASAAGVFLNEYKVVFTRAGGVLVILFGLYQLGLFGSSRLLSEEHRIPFHAERIAMSPVSAFVMGFTFSFAWTPCVGPALASVLLMAGSSGNGGKAFLLIGVYTLGFILPFLAAGIFTGKLISLFRKHVKVVKYTVKAGGVLMVFLGVVMLAGTIGDSTDRSASEKEEKEISAEERPSAENPDELSGRMAAFEFTLYDQYGNEHSLEDYRGKVVFLNFWATWCGPCRNEMPDIQKLYEEYQSMGSEAQVVILGVAGPGYGGEGTVSDVSGFLEENGYTYTVLMDEGGQLFRQYGISAFPTTFMIDREGYVYGYVQGQLTEETMRDIIGQTLNGG